MRTLPAGWPDPDAAVKTAPKVYLRFIDSTWPAAHNGMPDGWLSLGHFTTTRDLVGSLLPGAVRQATGFSVGTGQFDARTPPTTVAPWLTGTAKVEPTGQVELVLSYDGPLGDTVFSLGEFQVDPISGSLSDPVLSIDVIETSIRLRQIESLLPFVGQRLGSDELGVIRERSVDAAWVVDALARRGGFYATPPAPADAVFDLPLQGGAIDLLTFEPTAAIADDPRIEFTAGLGGIVPVSPFALGATIGDLTATNDVYFALTFTGTVTIDFFSDDIVELRPDGEFAVKDTDGSWITGTYTPGLDQNWPDRVELNVSVLPGTFMRARVRSSPTAPWSSYATQVVGGSNLNDPTITCEAGSTFNGLAIYGTAATEAWTAQSASLLPLDRKLWVADFDENTSTLSAMQQVVAGALGAMWFSAGVAIVRPRTWLLGDTETVDTVQVLTKFENIKWKVDPNDVADRVELSFVEPVIDESGDAVIWEADEVITVRAGGRTTFRVQPSRPFRNTGPGPVVGGLAVDVEIQFTPGGGPGGGASYPMVLLPSGEVEVTIINQSGEYAIHFMDGSGNPAFKITAAAAAQMSTTTTIAMGVDALAATSPLPVNLGKWCQDPREAKKALKRIYRQTRAANYRIEDVSISPDLRRELGDVVRLQFTKVGIDTKAIITRLVQDDFSQRATFTILDPIIRDFNEAWDAAMPGATIADFNAFWDSRLPGATIADFNNDPLATP